MLTGSTQFCPNNIVLNVYFLKSFRKYIREGHLRLSTDLTSYSKSSARRIYFAFDATYRKLENRYANKH